MSLHAVPRSVSPVSPLVLDEQARIRATLARVRIFEGLPAGAVEELADRVQLRRVLGGQPILSQDQPGDALFVIMSGRVKVVVFGDSGREVTLSVLRPTDIFGEMSLFDGEHGRSANVVAIDPTTVLVISRAELERHIVGHPQTAMRLLGELARRLRRADETIAELALCDVPQRLIRKLIGLAKEEGNDSPEGMVIRRRPTQQDLANMVGSCRETISRTFNQLARRGLIVPRGRSLLVTRRLVQMSEQPAPRAA
jgi:CRP-like cAMP-binding protein